MLIPTDFLDLFQGKAIAHLATLMPDGGPQLTPVWIDYDGTHVLVNSSRGRIKNNNMQVGARVAIEIVDLKHAYRYISVRGHVADVTTEGSATHIEKLAQRYLGTPYPWWQPNEVRELFLIVVDKVVTRSF